MLLELGTLGTTVAGWAQAAMSVADTVVTLQGSSTGLQRWVDLLTSISSIVIAIALIAIAIPLVPAAWNSRKVYRKINKLIERFQQDVNPILQHANEVADNVNYISSSIRMDVEQFKSTIDETQKRLNRAAALAEQRINQFNALLEVVQEEAEDLFVETASTVRGVRAGTDALGKFRSRPEWDATTAAEELEIDRGAPPRSQP